MVTLTQLIVKRARKTSIIKLGPRFKEASAQKGIVKKIVIRKLKSRILHNESG